MTILQAIKKLKKAFPGLYTICKLEYVNRENGTLKIEKEVYVADISKKLIFLKGDSNTDWKELVDRAIDRAIDARGGKK